MKNAIQWTIVARRREEVRDDRREQRDRARDKTGSAGKNGHTLSDGEESESETVLDSDEQFLWYATDDTAEYEETAAFDNIEKVLTTCNRCGALGHWEDECPQKGHRRRSSPSDRSSGSGRFRKQSSSRKRSPEGKVMARDCRSLSKDAPPHSLLKLLCPQFFLTTNMLKISTSRLACAVEGARGNSFKTHVRVSNNLYVVNCTDIRNKRQWWHS